MIKLSSAILTPEECLTLCEDSEPFQTPSLVQYGDRRRLTPSLRRSVNYRWRSSHVVAEKVRAAAARLTQLPLDLVEPIDVVRYRPGDFFGRHHDGEFRSHTLCVTLSNGYQGGRLVFPDLGQSFAIPLGDGILWENLPLAFHLSEPVESGEKWVAVAWIAKDA